MRPGTRKRPFPSTIVAPAGASRCAPILTILSPWMRTSPSSAGESWGRIVAPRMSVSARAAAVRAAVVRTAVSARRSGETRMEPPWGRGLSLGGGETSDPGCMTVLRGGAFLELVDQFAGTWRVVDAVAGAELTFFDDETGHFRLAGLAGSMQCRFGETLDGVSCVRFHWAGHDESGRAARGTGLARLALDSNALRCSIAVVGGRESSFEATRDGRALGASMRERSQSSTSQ